MAKELKYGVTLNGWEYLLSSLEANSGDFAHLEEQRLQLGVMLAEARDTANEQAAFTASKQDATQRLHFLLAEGRKLATFLRNGIRQRYGNRAEKLVEFNLQPFRGRPRKAPEGGIFPPPPPTPE